MAQREGDAYELSSSHERSAHKVSSLSNSQMGSYIKLDLLDY